MKVDPVTPIDTSAQYQDYIKNRKHNITQKKNKPKYTGPNFKEMVLKEIENANKSKNDK
jgi:hypothetical protein